MNSIETPENDKPPFGGKWRNWYLAVLLALGVQILLYYLLTQKYS